MRDLICLVKIVERHDRHNCRSLGNVWALRDDESFCDVFLGRLSVSRDSDKARHLYYTNASLETDGWIRSCGKEVVNCS